MCGQLHTIWIPKESTFKDAILETFSYHIHKASWIVDEFSVTKEELEVAKMRDPIENYGHITVNLY